MKNKIWEINYLSPPPVLKHCKKCGKTTAFICSEQFRVNAQRRCLDIWLIYKCCNCETTWNATVYSRISPQSLSVTQLECFHKNDEALAKQYAMDCAFLMKNGVEASVPQYTIIGDSFFSDEVVELTIKNSYSFPIKISALVREKLHLSHKSYLQLIANGNLKSLPPKDLQKEKLKKEIILLFNKREG